MATFASTQTQSLASYLESGCVAHAFEAHLHGIVAHIENEAPSGYSLSSLLADGKPKSWASTDLSLALLELKEMSAVAASTCTRDHSASRHSEYMTKAAASLVKSDPQEVAALMGRVGHAQNEILSATTMPAVSGHILDSLRACKQLTRLAIDNGSLMDVDTVVARYSEPGSSRDTPEHVLCRGFSAKGAAADKLTVMLTDSQLIRSLTFMAFELCHSDGLLKLESRQKFSALQTTSARLTGRRLVQSDAKALTAAMNDAERSEYESAASLVMQSTIEQSVDLSSKVILMASPKHSPNGQPYSDTQSIMVNGNQRTGAMNDFLTSFAETQSRFDVTSFQPIYRDPETPSVSVRDALVRVLHDFSSGKIGRGDILCIVRSASDADDGSRSMFMNQEAVDLCGQLRRAGLVVISGLSSKGGQIPFEGASNSTCSSPSETAVLAGSLLIKQHHESVAAVRLSALAPTPRFS